MRILRRISACAVLAVGLTIASVQAQVLKQVPDTAMVVVKVDNLQKTSTKIANLAKKLGIAQMVPQFADPLGALEQHLHGPKGINKDGDMAFVFIDPSAGGGQGDKSLMLLIPVSDYAQFVSNFQNPKVDGDVTQVVMPDGGDEGFIAHWGTYAALSPSKDLVAKAPAQILQVEGVSAKELQEKDLVVYANFARIKAMALPALAQNRQQILMAMEKGIEKSQNAKPGPDGQAPASAAAIKVIVNQMLNLAQEFLQDTQAITWGLNFADDGIKSGLVVEFDPKTYLGQIAQSAKNTDQSLINGLPNGNYLVYGGMKVDPERTVKLIDDLAGPVIRDLKAAGTDTAALEKFVGAMRDAYSASEKVAMGWTAPTGALGQDSLFQVITIMTGDAAKLAAAQKVIYESQPAIGQMMGQPEGQTKVSLTPNAKTVDGVSFDLMKTTFTFAGNTPQEMQAQQFINFIYGPNGVNGYVGKVDDKHFLTVVGANDETLTKAVAAVKSDDTTLAKQEILKLVDAQLPQSRLGVFYVPVDHIVTTGVTYAKQFGLPIQLQLPPNLPPIGVALSTESSAYRVDSYVPATLVQSLIAAGMQAWMAVQGGGAAQPGGAGGL